MKNSAKCIIFLLISLFCVKIQGSTTRIKPSRKVGPYTIAIRNIDTCHLPGPVDREKEASNDFGVTKVSRTKEELRGSIFIPQDVPNIRGSISMDFWRDGGYKPFFNTVFSNPCKEEFIGLFLKTYLSVGKNCLIKKGNFSMAGLEPTEILYKIIGPNFFYEKVLISFAFYSKEGSVFCLKVALESKPLIKVTRGGTKTN